MCFGFNNKAVEIWNILFFFSSPFGNHGDSSKAYIQSLWEGITLEISLLKNDFKPCSDTWIMGRCFLSTLFALLNQKSQYLSGYWCGHHCWEIAQWQWNFSEIILKLFSEIMCPGTLKWYFHHLDILLVSFGHVIYILYNIKWHLEQFNFYS